MSEPFPVSDENLQTRQPARRPQDWLRHPYEMQRHRRAQQSELKEEALTRRNAARRMVDRADYPSIRAFYAENFERRGDDVFVAEKVDGELVWSICWLPRTTEVAAFAVSWSDERWHRKVMVSDSWDGVRTGLRPEPIPEVVYLLGHAESAEDARVAVDASVGLDRIRDALM